MAVRDRDDDRNFVGDDCPFVVRSRTPAGERPLAGGLPQEVQVWVQRPDGSVLATHLLSLGTVVHLGAGDPALLGDYRAVFTLDAKGTHVARCAVTDATGLKKHDREEFYVRAL